MPDSRKPAWDHRCGEPPGTLTPFGADNPDSILSALFLAPDIDLAAAGRGDSGALTGRIDVTSVQLVPFCNHGFSDLHGISDRGSSSWHLCRLLFRVLKRIESDPCSAGFPDRAVVRADEEGFRASPSRFPASRTSLQVFVRRFSRRGLWGTAPGSPSKGRRSAY